MQIQISSFNQYAIQLCNLSDFSSIAFECSAFKSPWIKLWEDILSILISEEMKEMF